MPDTLAAAFEALQHQDMTAALEAGSRAVVYCVQAGAYERLGEFAGGVVTSTADPRLLEAFAAASASRRRSRTGGHTPLA